MDSAVRKCTSNDTMPVDLQELQRNDRYLILRNGLTSVNNIGVAFSKPAADGVGAANGLIAPMLLPHLARWAAFR
jgi:hypothetical protein